MAEGQRFELWVPCGTAVFKTAALNHSAIPPGCCAPVYSAEYQCIVETRIQEQGEYREVDLFVKIFFKNLITHSRTSILIMELEHTIMYYNSLGMSELFIFSESFPSEYDTNHRIEYLLTEKNHNERIFF